MNLSQLKQVCLADFDYFARAGGLVEEKEGKYIYLDRGSTVLAVAHLDTVQHTRHFQVTKIMDQETVFCGQLDDRLGAYIIGWLLPSMGIVPDILFTDGEETGRSTAGIFKPPEGKQWNWMFSFDRRGTDVVTYDYGSKHLDGLLESFGFKVGIGSFSDIARLYRLGVKGFNFGCGYRDYHSRGAHVFLADTYHMVQRFVRFWMAMKDIRLPHDPKSITTQRSRYRQSWEDYPYAWGQGRETPRAETYSPRKTETTSAEETHWRYCTECGMDVRADSFISDVNCCEYCFEERQGSRLMEEYVDGL